MEHDIHTLIIKYPSLLHGDSLGKTPDGRYLYHLVIGNENAEKQILLFASIHAREYITTPLLMRQTAALLQNLSDQTASYRGCSYQDLMKNIAIHIVPMINPDGVSISQFGMDGIRSATVRQEIYKIYELDQAVEIGSYLRTWKSNAQGVDLNRNFDAMWDSYNDHLGHPSSDHYKGTSPASTEEAKTLIKLTEQYPFKRTVSYHTQGEVIYWYFAQTGDLLNESKALAESASAVTGYPLDADYTKLDPAGYKDWAIQKKNIPSLTIEVGRGTNPLEMSQLPAIYEQNKNVIGEILYGLRE